jgi:exonuclease SbcD
VIRGVDIPENFCAVLSGHIHRCQTLRRDLQGKMLLAPVVYPGSVERTAFAEQKEEKGYLILDISDGKKPGGQLEEIEFHSLPTRPMVTLNFHLDSLDDEQMLARLETDLAALDANAVVRIRLQGEITESAWHVFGAANLRSLAPSTMNITVSAAWRESA